MKNRVVITGLGCITPIGNHVDETWQNILAGVSGVAKITRFDTSEYKTKIGAEIRGFDPNELLGRKEARRMDRYSQYALAAAIQALEESQLSINDTNRDRIGAVIGSGIGGLETTENQIRLLEKSGPGRVSPFLIPMMLVDSAGGLLAIHLGVRGPNLSVVTACATGTNAIGEAAEIIRRGQADVMFSGGAEASIIPIAIAGMNSMTALSTRNEEPERASRPFDLERDGFIMGEGAAVLVLESLEFAKGRGAKILGEVLGYGSTNDAFHISAPAEKGEGAARCMQMALESANLQPKEIDYINAHGTSTTLNDKNEIFAIKAVFKEQAYEIPVSSTKSMTGHLLGATGALEALFCVKAIQDNLIPPTINYENPDPECDLDYVPNKKREKELYKVISNSFGFGGHNASIILGEYKGGN